MSSGYLVPMLLLTGISFCNAWYNKPTSPDLKIPLEGAIATGLLALASNIPGVKPVAAGIAWVAFVAVLIGPAQNPSPATNLLKIVG